MTIEQLCKVDDRPSQGVVSTNIELVRGMINQLPNHIKESSTTTFLEPCFGSGTFIFELIRELRKYGHSMENIQNRIYGCETFGGAVNKVKRNLSNYDFKNIYNTDFLTHDFRNMKFDVILGNPPYQNSNFKSSSGNLYSNFTKLAFNILKPTGKVSFITPETIIRAGKQKFSLKEYPGLKYINHTTDSYFSVGVKIISWLIDKEYKGSIKVINKDGSSEDRTYSDLLSDKNDILAIKLFEKIKSNNDKLFYLDQSARNRSKEPKKGWYKVIKNMNKNTYFYTDKKPILYKDKKLSISLSSKYKPEMLKESSEDFGQLHCMVSIEGYSKTQIQNLKDFMFHPLCISICNKYKLTTGQGMNAILYTFPKIDINKLYKEQDIIDLFNLTNEEVNFLK